MSWMEILKINKLNACSNFLFCLSQCGVRALSICRSFTSAGQRTNKIIASLPWFTIQPYTQLIITHYSNITFIHIAQNCSSYRLLPWTFSPERVTLLSCCYENLADLSLSIRPILTHVTPNTVRCVA